MPEPRKLRDIVRPPTSRVCQRCNAIGRASFYIGGQWICCECWTVHEDNTHWRNEKAQSVRALALEGTE